MISKFVYANSLQDADAIIAKKRGWGVFDHFIIYMGQRFGCHMFIANNTDGGVQWLNEAQVEALIQDFEPVKIRKFSGSYKERMQALERAKQELGKQYSLTDFNCEHLANYIQYGVRVSKQADNWKAGITLAAGVLVAAILFGD